MVRSTVTSDKLIARNAGVASLDHTRIVCQKSPVFPTSSGGAAGASSRRFRRRECVAWIDIVCNCVCTSTPRVFPRSEFVTLVASVSRFPTSRCQFTSALLPASPPPAAALRSAACRENFTPRAQRGARSGDSPPVHLFTTPCCQLIAASTRSHSRRTARWLIKREGNVRWRVSLRSSRSAISVSQHVRTYMGCWWLRTWRSDRSPYFVCICQVAYEHTHTNVCVTRNAVSDEAHEERLPSTGLLLKYTIIKQLFLKNACIVFFSYYTHHWIPLFYEIPVTHNISLHNCLLSFQLSERTLGEVFKCGLPQTRLWSHARHFTVSRHDCSFDR